MHPLVIGHHNVPLLRQTALTLGIDLENPIASQFHADVFVDLVEDADFHQGAKAAFVNVVAMVPKVKRPVGCGDSGRDVAQDELDYRLG